MDDKSLPWPVQILIAVFGGVAAFMLDDKFTIKDFICSLILAGFAGLLAFLMCQHLSYSGNVTGFFCGVAGLTAKPFLILIKSKYKKILSAFLGGNTGKGD